jgi:DNA-binding response OmpR family regulator
MTNGSVPLRILLYSDDVNTRNNVKQLLGLRPALELPKVEFVEVATEPVVIRQMDAGDIDLAILDGEAVPAGGMGITRQLKDEIYRCPPILVLVARQSDAWLATWSRADAVAPRPLDPLGFPELVASLLRQRIGSLPTV